VQVSSEDAIEGMAYYIALYLSRAPEARCMEPKQLQAALRQTMTVSLLHVKSQQPRLLLSTHLLLICLARRQVCAAWWWCGHLHPKATCTTLPYLVPHLHPVATRNRCQGRLRVRCWQFCVASHRRRACVALLGVCVVHQAQTLPRDLGLGPLLLPLGCCQLQRTAAV
jgi:hypothetical protein